MSASSRATGRWIPRRLRQPFVFLFFQDPDISLLPFLLHLYVIFYAISAAVGMYVYFFPIQSLTEPEFLRPSFLATVALAFAASIFILSLRLVPGCVLYVVQLGLRLRAALLGWAPSSGSVALIATFHLALPLVLGFPALIVAVSSPAAVNTRRSGAT
eukprot:TRINITY_DN40302_c0_g1_i1.p1 TRINITY_DN40302_c0_g1~~TRINITY_DN40302_c0_g1_i1.p1  ORF type:complete len:158 (-),score=12.45 TRINITY_DN40302_c0_g1_i1:81-554(-)